MAPTSMGVEDDDGKEEEEEGDEQKEEEEEDTIATRTRTKFSLVDVEIDTLEASLADQLDPLLELEPDEREYQLFLSSLLPQEEEDNLDFLDEEDEEYRPDEEDEDDEEEDDDDAQHDETTTTQAQFKRRTHTSVPRISKKELTELLWDSTKSVFPATKLPVLPANEEIVLPSVSPPPSSVETPAPRPQSKSTAKKPKPKARSHARTHTLRHLPGRISQEQCIQLASQMHKHLQLLLQNYHALKNNQSSHENLRDCQQMLEELQVRSEKALKCKGALLSKLNPSRINGSTIAASTSSSPEDQLALEQRRVTRSLTAAHAAVAHPSMFEIVGTQSMDELTAQLATKCLIADRNKHLQDQLLELDKHLLLTKKKNPKKPFTVCEDNLLAHGVKRFGFRNAWPTIATEFLPGKRPELLQRRYKYLISNKTGMNAAKILHQYFPLRQVRSWLLEEDVRVARGMIEYANESKRFARICTKYLPHRSRFEVRKRWEIIRSKVLEEKGDIYALLQDDDPSNQSSMEFLVAVKDHLEAKLRQQMQENRQELQQQMQHSPAKSQNEGKEAGVKNMMVDNQGALAAAIQESKLSCRRKNLHPALFFTSWAMISPATLLQTTCEHNWPSFIDETARQQMLMTQPAPPSSSAPDPSSSLSTTPASVSASSPPSDDSTARNDSMEEKGDDQHATAPDVDDLTVPEEQEEDEEDEEDDSEYEHDALLSSENDEESESEFEKMELSDEDDDEGQDGDEEESKEATTPSTVRHTLRLENLRKPGNERMQRALAALERRIMGQTTASASTEENRSKDSVKRPEEHASSSSSDDENFECDELLDDDDDEDQEEEEEDPFFPNKRHKATVTFCSDCNRPPTHCHCDRRDRRMQQLLRRMAPTS